MVEERAELKGCTGSGSGARGGREIDGAALVRVQRTVVASAAPSMPDETTGNSSSAFHPARGGGARLLAVHLQQEILWVCPQTEVQLMVLQKMDCVGVCWV